MEELKFDENVFGFDVLSYTPAEDVHDLLHEEKPLSPPFSSSFSSSQPSKESSSSSTSSLPLKEPSSSSSSFSSSLPLKEPSSSSSSLFCSSFNPENLFTSSTSSIPSHSYSPPSSSLLETISKEGIVLDPDLRAPGAPEFLELAIKLFNR
jgi:hypothetical protein